MEAKFYGVVAWVTFFGMCVLAVFAARELLADDSADAAGAQRGKASWYSRAECCTRANPNALMANGKALRDDRYTCASWTYPLGTVVRVTHGARHVDCVVTDRGPARRLNRAIDLTRCAFARLAPLSRGVIDVSVEEVRP